MPNLNLVYPVAWTNPVILRASAALPAAGAWDPAPTEQNIAGAGSLTLAFTYTEGAVGGAVDFQIQTSLYSVVGNVPAGAGEWQDEAVVATGGVFAGADTQSLVQGEYTTFNPVGVGIETFSIGPIEVSHTIERIRILARESGVVGTPGLLQITGTIYP